MNVPERLIFLKAISREWSCGMRVARDRFTAAGKRIAEMLPGVMPAEFMRSAA
jgi:hypothetical protein